MSRQGSSTTSSMCPWSSAPLFQSKLKFLRSLRPVPLSMWAWGNPDGEDRPVSTLLVSSGVVYWPPVAVGVELGDRGFSTGRTEPTKGCRGRPRRRGVVGTRKEDGPQTRLGSWWWGFGVVERSEVHLRRDLASERKGGVRG